MASLTRSVVKNLQTQSNNSYLKFIINPSSIGYLNIQRNYSRKIPEYFERFKVEPRQPILDLVEHKLIYKGVDPAPYFMNQTVQKILKDLTGRDVEKVFRHRKTKRIDRPQYEFLTDAQLQMAYDRAEEAAKHVLQMPPVLKIREDTQEVIQRNPEIKGLHDSVLLITDISADMSDSKRLILVRDQDGTLKHANLEQRHRMNCIYNPRKGRTLHMPALFSLKNLMPVLAQKEYEFVLDRACLQMEPYEETFQSVQAVTFEAIDKEGDFEMLLSTRHYGPMVFFLTWHKKIDRLLENLVKRERMDEVEKLLSLYCIIHPDSKLSSTLTEDMEPELKLQAYLDTESKDNSTLLLSLQVYRDVQKNRAEYSQKHGESL